MNIILEGRCDVGVECGPLATSTHQQLASGRYSRGCSTMPLPEDLSAHLAVRRTFRKRAARAERLGYRFDRIDRKQHESDVYDINTSAARRQGRPMADAYTRPVTFSPLPVYPCRRHAINTYGVLQEGLLRAYTFVYRVGDLVMFSTLLGHAAHLTSDIMYLLFRGTLACEIANGPGCAFYNLHYSGSKGLRFFKERVGFAPTDIEWVLA